MSDSSIDCVQTGVCTKTICARSDVISVLHLLPVESYSSASGSEISLATCACSSATQKGFS